MFSVTTTLPAAHEPVSKAVLQNKLKTRKTDAEIEAIKQERKQKIEEAAAAAAAAQGEGKKKKKNNKKQKEALAELKDDDAIFYNFTDVPLAE